MKWRCFSIHFSLSCLLECSLLIRQVLSVFSEDPTTTGHTTRLRGSRRQERDKRVPSDSIFFFFSPGNSSVFLVRDLTCRSHFFSLFHSPLNLLYPLHFNAARKRQRTWNVRLSLQPKSTPSPRLSFSMSPFFWSFLESTVREKTGEDVLPYYSVKETFLFLF